MGDSLASEPRTAQAREEEQPPALFGSDYYQDPFTYWARKRESQPVTAVTGRDGQRRWFITRYEDVRAALADPRLAKDLRKMFPDWEPHPVMGTLNMHMLNMDPPDHTRLRRLVTKAFTPRRVAALRPRIGEITASLLDEMDASAAGRGSGAPAPGAEFGPGAVDLMDAFAFPLPITVICELLGIPPSDREHFRSWTSVILSSEGDHEMVLTSAEAMFGYFRELVDGKRRSPGDDLLSALVLARDEGDTLTERELYAMVFLLLIAGFETTVNLIASGTLALLTFPDELARLRDDPSLLPSAVEELLRYANPLIHATERFTLEDTEIGGVVIPAREWVFVVTSSANRDPARFASPEELDLSRDASGHVAFGHGIHHCLGAPLARLEGEIAFGSMLARFPSLSLAVPPSSLRWRHSSLMHSLESLPVRLRP